MAEEPGPAGALWLGSPNPPRSLVKAVLLDMDGVLVDVRGSFRRAIAETVRHFSGREPAPGAVQAKKDAGGFNNDWVLSQSLLRDMGHEVPFDDVVGVFRGIYLGRDHDGLIASEPAAIETATLEALAERYRLALVTGRPDADAQWTLDRFGWTDLVPVVVGMDRQAGREKPDPYGLALALSEVGAEARDAVFAGDTVDDVAAALAAGCTPVGVVPPGHDPDAHGRTLMGAGAHVVLSTPNALPALLATLEREG